MSQEPRGRTATGPADTGLVERAEALLDEAVGQAAKGSYREAAELGIDNLEHGLFPNSEYVPDKKPDMCPSGINQVLINLDINGAAVQETIRVLVAKNVAITSTLYP